MAYSFKQIEAHDPNNPGLVAPNAMVTIFEPGDPAMTPLTLTTLTGQALANPVKVNGLGYGPPFMHATLSQVAWSGGGLTGTFESYHGLRDEALAARGDANAAASNAAAAATQELETRIAAGEFKGEPGADGSNVLPTEDAIAAAVNGNGPAKAALNATYASKWKANAAYAAGEAVVNPTGDLVTAISAHTSGGAYDSTKWNLSTTYATPADAGRAPLPTRRWPQLTVLSDMSSGWTVGSAASSNLADSTDKAIGATSLSFVTNTTGGGAYTENHSFNVDMTSKGLIVWVKFDSGPIANIVQMLVYVTSDASGVTNRWAAQLFINNNKYPVKVGEWYPLQIPNAHLRMNAAGTVVPTAIKGVRVQVYPLNGQAVPVRIGGVATYSETSQAWPSGVISFTFDDSAGGAWTYGMPKLAARGWAGTLFPIVENIGTAGNLTLAQVKALQDVYGWEIGAHAMTNASHTDYTNQTTAWIRAEQLAMRRWQQANNFRSSSFAYPIGPYSSAATHEVAGHYESARSTGDFVDSVNVTDPMRMGSLVLAANVTLATAKARVDAAVDGKGWLKLTFHNIVASGATGNDWNVADFNALVDYIATKNIAVARIADVFHPWG